MYIPKYFTIHELVDPYFLKYPEQTLWSRFHAPYLMALDRLRERYGRMVINGSFNGQTYTQSGARRFDTTLGAELSLHKFWAAFDTKYYDVTPEEVMMDILANEHLWDVIGRMEDARVTLSWLHLDFGNRRLTNPIHIFKP